MKRCGKAFFERLMSKEGQTSCIRCERGRGVACAAAVQKGAKAKPRDGGARAREVSETEFMMRKREVEWSTEGRRAGKRGERGVDAVVRAGVPRCSAAGVLTPQCRRSAAPVYTSPHQLYAAHMHRS